MDPATAMLVATAVASAAKGAGDYFSSKKGEKAGKLRAKETKRETYGGLLNDAMQRGADLQDQRLSGTRRLGKRKATSMQETADLVRGAFNI